MTKVQTAYRLSRVLSEQDLENIARVHTVYGIFAVRVQPSLEELLVEYDASRLSAKEVEATLEQHGIPVA
jgi:copper chaperone CopZ